MTLTEAIERLDKSYELVYVDYRDELSDEQVAAIVRGDIDSLWESIDEWENESRWEGARYVIGDTFSDEEWESLTRDEQEEVRVAIEERDSSDVIGQLIRHTSDPLLRISCVDEDRAWSFEPVTPDEVLAQVGLEATEHNVKAVDYALANASPEFSVLMGYWIVSVDLATLYAAPEGATVTIENPHLYLGNPFAGSGFITEEPLEGTVTVPREELRTDKDAFGYAVDEVYGGLSASQFHADIVVGEGG